MPPVTTAQTRPTATAIPAVGAVTPPQAPATPATPRATVTAIPAVGAVTAPQAPATPVGARPTVSAIPAVGAVTPPQAPATARPTTTTPAVGAVTPPVAPASTPRIAPVVPPTASASPAMPPAMPPSVPSIASMPTPPPVAPPRPPAASTPPPPPAAAGGPALSPEQLADLESRCAKLDQLDYFELLGVARTAVPGDIKKAFYKESRVYHPDRFFHLESKALKDQVNELYKRVTEAYYVLRDDTKRKKYLSDIAGPDRAQKLRFTDASESETKAAAKKEQEEQIGTHPKGRQFYTQAQKDLESGNPSAAERNLKMALTYEPANARYKEALAEAQKQTADKSKGDSSFKIR
ncbi:MULTISPECIES: J domain-containing protein [Corallococcus]|nr:DnaJ domain-containing protein [Corallococcus sp. AB032C]